MYAGGGAPPPAQLHGALLSSVDDRQTQTQHPPQPYSPQAGPQATSFGSSVREKVRKLENVPPNVSLLNHALMYISTSQPPAIKTHTQICRPKTRLKIDIVLKQTHRWASQNPDLSQNDEARLFQPLQTEAVGGISRGAAGKRYKEVTHWLQGPPVNPGPLWRERV